MECQQRRWEFHGRQFQDDLQPITTVRTDAAGQFETTFTVPEGFGFIHDVLVINKDGVTQNKAAFEVKMQASLSPSSGPVGTPIAIELKGVGWRPLENSWMVLYDNKFTGWMSSVTTDGLARATIPAAGTPGKHIIQIVHGSATFPYMNMQQSPQPDRPQWTFEFTITDGAAVLPPPAQTQSLPVERGIAPASAGQPVLWTDPVSGTVGTPVILKGSGLPSGEPIQLIWFRMTGSRVSGQGYQETSVSLGTLTVGANGEIEFPFKALDDLGGPHRIEAKLTDRRWPKLASPLPLRLLLLSLLPARWAPPSLSISKGWGGRKRPISIPSCMITPTLATPAASIARET